MENKIKDDIFKGTNLAEKILAENDKYIPDEDGMVLKVRHKSHDEDGVVIKGYKFRLKANTNITSARVVGRNNNGLRIQSPGGGVQYVEPFLPGITAAVNQTFEIWEKYPGYRGAQKDKYYFILNPNPDPKHKTAKNLFFVERTILDAYIKEGKVTAPKGYTIPDTASWEDAVPHSSSSSRRMTGRRLLDRLVREHERASGAPFS